MALIYVLKKDVKGLGLLTKVGMTLRTGDDRAKEYGGGGWECVKEYPVDVSDGSELKVLETRVHQRLESYRCHEAVGFGLTEVFTCSPLTAMAVVKKVVGNEPSMKDEAKRLKEKMTKDVISRFRKKYEYAYAQLIRDGAYKSKKNQGYYSSYKGYRDLDTRDIGLVKMSEEFLDLLDNSGGDDPVFRAMLKKELAEAKQRLGAAIANKEAGFDKQCGKCFKNYYLSEVAETGCCPHCGAAKGLGPGLSSSSTAWEFGCSVIVLLPVLFILGWVVVKIFEM